MFPTFISILDIQSWWEVPSIAHFCSLFRTAFNLLDFDIEDLEEALLTDGTEESSWLQELIVRLLSGCLPNNEISTFNYQMFLRRLFRQKCQEHDRYNPFNTDCDFTLLPLRTKVDILHALCDFRLDAEDVLDQLKNLEADSLRVEPLGYDQNDSAYWYFYGTRLYREDFEKKNNKKKAVWQVICFTEDDWFQLTKKFKNSSVKSERELYHTLSKNFLPELPRLFKEKERQARRRLLENRPKRTSERIRKLEIDLIESKSPNKEVSLKEDLEKKESEFRRRNSIDNKSSRSRERIIESDELELRHEMASKKKIKSKHRKSIESSDSERDVNLSKRKKSKVIIGNKSKQTPIIKSVGRQTNNSLSALDGQIVIQQKTPPTCMNREKLKTSQVFQQSDEDLIVGMHKILDFVKNHDDAWPFLDPVDEEYAPNYYSIIRRPMDLSTMEEKLDQHHYKSFDKFKADFQLIVNNCRLYNGAENEYTEMVDNLVKVFDKATEKFLDQISSSDDEIAVENFNSADDIEANKILKNTKRKKSSHSPSAATGNKSRKPALAAEGRKRERSSSAESSNSIDDNAYHDSNKAKKSKKQVEEKSNKAVEKKEVRKSEDRKSQKSSKKLQNILHKPDKHHTRNYSDDEPIIISKSTKLKKFDFGRNKDDKVKNKEKKSKKRDLFHKGRKKRKGNNSSRRRSKSKSTITRSPNNSSPTTTSTVSSPPPSSPDGFHDNSRDNNHIKFTKYRDNSKEKNPSNLQGSKNVGFPSWETSFFVDEPPPEDLSPPRSEKKNEDYDKLPFAFKPPKDKHNKLRETIEKLKAKSEINRMPPSPVYHFEKDDHLKENKDRNEEKHQKVHNKGHNKFLQPSKNKKNFHEQDHHGDNKKLSKKNNETSHHQTGTGNLSSKPAIKQSNYDALSLATEQTLKDINKWLDDTPKFGDFSSASNSPSYLAFDDFDLLGNSRTVVDTKKNVGKSAVLSSSSSTIIGAKSPIHSVKKENNSGPAQPREPKKKPSRDPSKFFGRRREIQRTIERLQPGKSKGNLISTVQNPSKPDEIFPLGPISKIKDSKNSLIVKTDTNAPKLSLGTVLDSFGKHKFVVDDENKKEENPTKDEEALNTTKDNSDKPSPTELVTEKSIEVEKNQKPEDNVDKETNKESKTVEEPSVGPTPNLSAWFKAFGAPKASPPQKKPEKPESSSKDEEFSKSDNKIPLCDPSPNSDSAHPVRQRRISTGSSMSEKSSFSQDLDSPRVGMEERGAYPAPYPSPLHKSPSNHGASPIMASPRPDISPRSQYPFTGQMRVGFYQDTVASSKSSPEKSCSPRGDSPYYQSSGNDPVYAPNAAVQGVYNTSYTANSPAYYTQQPPPNYSSTNPTPPYNMDGSNNSYYDTSKIMEQYQSKPSQNYTANSPASSQNSPVPQSQLSPHSPMVHLPQTSPSIHSPSIHSPNVQSPSMHSQSPHQLTPSPAQSLHSPASMNVGVVSPHHHPQINSPAMLNQQQQQQQHSPMSMNPANVESSFHQSEEISTNLTSHQSHKEQQQQQQQQQQINHPVFPVKKRAFLDLDTNSQFPVLQDEMGNRSNIQYPSRIPITEQDVRMQHLMQEQQQQQQQQQNKAQSLLHQPLEQHQLLHEQNMQQQIAQEKQQQQQQQQQQQKNIHNMLQQQQQQNQIRPPHHGVPTESSLRGMPYPPSATSSSPYNSNFNSRGDPYPLNVPTSRSLAPPPLPNQQQKIDISKFTNMGYTGPESVNFPRPFSQQYTHPELNYNRTTVQSAISQASQILTLNASQPSASTITSLPGYQKTASNQQQAHSSSYQQANRSEAERLTNQAPPLETGSYKQDTRNAYNSSHLDLEQAIGLSRNLSTIVDRYSNEQRMMAGLQSAPNPYYNDKGLPAPHIYHNKQIFSQNNMTAMGYPPPPPSQQSHQQTLHHQQQVPQSLYDRRQIAAEIQQPHEIKSSSPQATSMSSQEVRPTKPKKKKASSKGASSSSSSSNETTSVSSSQTAALQSHHLPPTSSQQQQQQQQGFQTYTNLKPVVPPPVQSTTSGGNSVSASSSSSLVDPAAIALKSSSSSSSSSSVPGSAFNFGTGTLGMPSGLTTEPYPNIMDDFRGTSNYFMAGANSKAAQSAQPYHPPPFLNPAAHHHHHQGRSSAYPPLGGPFMDTSSQFYQHYLQAGVLNPGLLGAAAAAGAGYPPGYPHPLAAMRQPYDSMPRPWL